MGPLENSAINRTEPIVPARDGLSSPSDMPRRPKARRDRYRFPALSHHAVDRGRFRCVGDWNRGSSCQSGHHHHHGAGQRRAQIPPPPPALLRQVRSRASSFSDVLCDTSTNGGRACSIKFDKVGRTAVQLVACSNDGAENLADARRESHRQCAPKRHPDGGTQNVGAAGFAANRAKKGKKDQGRSRDDRDQHMGG